MATTEGEKVKTRSRRSSSVIQYLAEPSNASEHHLLHLHPASTQADEDDLLSQTPVIPRPRKTKAGEKVKKPTGPRGSVYLRWVQQPQDTLTIVILVLLSFFSWHILFPTTAHTQSNPFSPFLFVSYPLPHKAGDPEGFVRHSKGWKDLLFLPFWVVAFSFIRQATTLWIVKPLGVYLGIKKGRKMERFQEQGYAVIYFFCSSVAGLYVMSHQPSWFYNCSEFWLGYPEHWAMPKSVKTYYLTQFAYWLQQALVMIAGLEKPRDDYVELVIHHIITLWLIGCSYAFNLTQIGIAIFVSMDIPDLLLAISKCINYCGLEKTGNCSFAVFLVTWTYFRHYQNLRILHSVWTEFTLVPSYARVWDAQKGYFMPSWMRYQIFAPIAALQLVIAFWSYLILRILVKMIRGQNAEDVREKDEGETEGETEQSEAEGGETSARSARREARQRRAEAQTGN